MIETIVLTILGDPRSQKRHRTFRRGNFTGQYDPSAADKKDFLAIVQKSAPQSPLHCPIRLRIIFCFARPRNHFGTGKNAGRLKENAPLYQTSRPDTDNCIKFIADALTGVYWRNDSQICELFATKLYAEKPRTEITITPLSD